MIDIYTDALNNVSWNIIQILCLIILISGIIIFIRSKRSVLPQYRLYIIVFLIVSLQMFMDGVIQPAILNTKSTKDFAHQVIDIVPNDNIYGYINVDMLRFYIVNFYTGDRVKSFDKESPENGYVLVGDRTFENDFIKKYGETYTFEPVLKTRHSQTELRDYITLYKFDLK